MSGSPLDILRFLEHYPGDLVFYLVIIALGQVSLFFAVGQRARFPTAPATQQYLLAASALIGVWVLVLAAAIVSLLSLVEPGSLLPPLERLAQTLSVTLFAWAFLTANEDPVRRPGNTAALGMVLMVLLFFLYTAYQWYVAFDVGAEFNVSEFAPVWSALPVAIAIAGLLLTLLNAASIVDAPLKSLFFLLILMGNGWDLYQFSESVVAGNYLGGARLAYMGALFVAPLLLYRRAIALMVNGYTVIASASVAPVSASQENEDSEPGTAAVQIVPEPAVGSGVAISAHATSEHLLTAIGTMLEIDEDSTISQQVVSATIAALEAEVCLLLQRQDANYADIAAGYDTVTQQTLAGISFNLDAQPSLRQAFEDGRPIVLSADAQGDEAAELFLHLGIDALGSVYLQPVTRREDVLAIIVVSQPYRNVDLSSDQVAMLKALANVAGRLLDSKLLAEAAAVLASPGVTAAVELGARAQDLDPADVLGARRELEASFEQTGQDIALLRITTAELLMQLHEERIRLLGDLGEDPETISVAQQVTIVFDEQTRLREASEKTASDLLDAETVLRILAADGDSEQIQVIRDYVQKSYDVQVETRDRLQGELDGLRSNAKSLGWEQPAAFVDTLTDESRRLETEVEQLEARLAEALIELDSIGVNPELGSLAQVLIQHHAEQSTLKNVVSNIQRQHDQLLEERSQLTAGGVHEMVGVRQQLTQMIADHESLLDQRENMRRAYEELQSVLKAKEGETASVVNESSDLRQELSASVEKQDYLNRSIAELTEERDNLLRIRDQLTNRLTASLDSGDISAEAALRTEVSELRAVANDLTGHRERLEAELSELRIQTSGDDQMSQRTATDNDKMIEAEALQTDIGRLLGALTSPVTAILDGTKILLAERIGILGAAQMRILLNVSENIGQLTEIIDELQHASLITEGGFMPRYRAADLVALLDNALGEHTDILRRKELAIDLSLSDGLPRIPMDKVCVSRILKQLLSNACEVSREGSQIQLSVEIDRQTLPGTDAPADVLHVCISDSGGGIDPENIARLFARRYQGVNPSIKGFSDTGVGMTVSRALARAHGGDLWISSEHGAGSTVHLALPISPSSTAEE